MKEISLEELFKIIGEACQKEFNKWYSTDWRDYEEDLRTAENNADYDEDKDLYTTHIKISESNDKYVDIDFYFRYGKTDNEDITYFID